MDTIEMKMRDKTKNIEYFESYIKEANRLKEKSLQRFYNGEIPSGRLDKYEYRLVEKLFFIFCAKYCLGHEIKELREFYITLINNVKSPTWGGKSSKVCVSRDTYKDQYTVEPHNKMLSLISLALLLKVNAKLFSVFSDIIDHDNISDNLYEFILKAEFSDRKRKRPEEYDPKHSVILKVYRNMRLAIEQTDKTEAQKLIKHFLEKDFYHKHSGFYNLHKEKFELYYGYWSFEAAAITCIMDLDDSSYRDNQYYPKDLVDFYRSTSLC